MASEKYTPEELVSLVKKSFEVRNDEGINMLPIYELISKVAEWDGPTGQEPEWLREADDFLTINFCSNFYSEEGLEVFDITQEELSQMSISERASIFNVFGSTFNDQNTRRDEPIEEPTERLLPNVPWPKYEPSPTSIIETAFANDGSYLLRAGCSECKQKTDLLTSKEAFAWVDSHKLSCQ